MSTCKARKQKDRFLSPVVLINIYDLKHFFHSPKFRRKKTNILFRITVHFLQLKCVNAELCNTDRLNNRWILEKLNSFFWRVFPGKIHEKNDTLPSFTPVLGKYFRSQLCLISLFVDFESIIEWMVLRRATKNICWLSWTSPSHHFRLRDGDKKFVFWSKN